MLGLMLGMRGPRDLLNGQRVSLAKALAWQNEKEYHHVFPRAFLQRAGVPDYSINSVCNFALLSSASNKEISDKKPSEYILECRRRLGDDFMDVMRSNLISEQAVHCILEDDYQGFQNARCQSLHEYAEELCGWGNSTGF